MKRGKLIIWYFIVVSALALLSQSGVILVLAFFLLVAPGLILWASNTVLAYSVALIPVYLIAPHLKRAPSMLAPALLPALMLVFLPHYLSQPAYHAFTRPYLAQDFSTPAQPGMHTVLLEGPLVRPHAEDGCVELCQQLLYGGDVESVLQIHYDGTFRYRIEHRDVCPELPTNAATPYARARSLSGDCLIGEPSTDAQADVSIASSRVRDNALEAVSIGSAQRFRLWAVDEVRRFDVFERHDGVMMHVERRTRIAGEVASAPLYFGLASTGSIETYPETARTEIVVQDASLESVLAQRYGWRVAPIEENLDTARVSRNAQFREIMERRDAADVALTSAEMEVIDAITSEIARRETHTTADLIILRAVIRKPSVTGHFRLRWRSDLAPLIPDAIARLETPLIHDREQLRYVLSNFLAEAPLENLRPYADRIIAILQDDRGRYLGSLMAELPRITSRDVAPTLLRWIDVENPSDGPITGLCYAASPGRTNITTSLSSFLRNDPFNARPQTTRAAMAGLIRSAGIQAATDIETSLRDNQRPRYRRHLSEVRRTRWPENCS
jgi:hypothetical protein